MEINKDTPFARIILTGLVMLLSYSGIIYKLKEEQISSGEEHRKKILDQSIRQIRLPGVRGRIFTSNGEHVLADNKVSYNVVFHVSEMRQPGKRRNTLDFIIDSSIKVAKALGRKNKITKADIIKHMNYRPGLPMTVYENMDREELGIASELYPPIKGMEIVPIPSRVYPEKDMAAHLLGRVRQGDPKLADDREEFFYYIPDQVGINGLEKFYDRSVPESEAGFGAQQGMLGRPGKRTVRVDHRGYIYEQIGFDQPSKNGNDLILTLDYKAQKIAERLLKTTVDEQGRSPARAAFVLMDADTGALLAMASSPTFNVDQLVPRIPTKLWDRLNNDELKPLINRVTSAFTPGSIVKPLVSLAYLRDGINPQHVVDCQGKTYISGARIRCHNHYGHGPTNMFDAIRQSCNVYFIDNSQQVGMEKITDVFRSAGIGADTGFILPDNDGINPTRERILKRNKHKWTAYDTALLSMGQGFITVTPLQAATYTAAIANGGTLYQPQILKEVKTSTGSRVYSNKSKVNGKLKATQEELNHIREGMWRVVNTSSKFAARNSYIELSGKTGSAENGPRGNLWTNTWFIGYGSYEGKTYSLAIIVEHGKSGSRTSAPIAGKFFEQWLDPDHVE